MHVHCVVYARALCSRSREGCLRWDSLSPSVMAVETEMPVIVDVEVADDGDGDYAAPLVPGDHTSLAIISLSIKHQTPICQLM